MTNQCPKCQSSKIETLDQAKQVGAVIGTVSGSASGAVGALAGARFGGTVSGITPISRQRLTCMKLLDALFSGANKQLLMP